MIDPEPIPDNRAEDAFRSLDLDNAAKRVRETTGNPADALKVEVKLFVISRGMTLTPEERGVLLEAALSKALPENREKMSALLDQSITRWQSSALRDYTVEEEKRRDADPIGDPPPPEEPQVVEGNGKHTKEKKKPLPKALSEAVRKLGLVKEDGSGPDPQSVMELVMPLILNGTIPEAKARKALTEAYPSGGDATFDAAMAVVKAAPRTVPILSHKEGLKSADAFILLNHTQDGVRILHRYQQEFYRWDGAAYRLIEEEALTEPMWRFLKLGTVDPSQSRVSNVMSAVKGFVHLPKSLEPTCWLGAPVEGYPEPKDLVPLKNGLLHPTTRTMYPHTPRLFNLSSLPFEYDPADAVEPKRWLKFLHELWPDDQQSIDTLQEMFGYLLSGDNRLHKMFMVVGPARSGKGTIGHILSALLGRENIASPSLDSLCSEHGLQALRGKSIALVPEAKVTAHTDSGAVSSILKAISGGDPVNVNPKYLNPVSVVLSTRFVLFSNDVPWLLDASGAVASRFIVLCLTESWLGREDIILKEKLAPELPQILHWALEGQRRLYARTDEDGNYLPHFLMPDSSKEVLAELADAASPIGAFLREHCVLGPLEKITCQRMWELWCAYTQEQGHKDPGKQPWFGRDLRAAIPNLKKRSVRDGAKRIQTYFGVGEAHEGLLP